MGRTNIVPVAERPPVTLGRADYDFNHDGVPDRLSLIWSEGKFLHFDEDDPWCGQGDKYSGKFIFRVELGNGATIDTSLDSLYPDGSFDFFRPSEQGPWEITITDYNNDGQPDFNIVSYGACRYSRCWLFTVLPSGKVEALKVEGTESCEIDQSPDGSMANFGQKTPQGLYYEYFDRDDWSQHLEFLDWDTTRKIFHVRDQAIKLRE